MADVQEPRDPAIEDVIADIASASPSPAGSSLERVMRDVSRVDHAVYDAIASTPTPALDEPLRRLSNAANNSLVWVAIAGGLAVVGGRRGRRAALAGLASVAVSSGLVNVGLKSIYERARPDRVGAGVIEDRHVAMPLSSSFPSGHSASGFAFATAVARVIPELGFPLGALAAAVAYSRVHTGVHYPGDALAGSLVGGSVGFGVGGRFDRRGTR
jgi:membrane-associated phospholipid phosphatase